MIAVNDVGGIKLFYRQCKVSMKRINLSEMFLLRLQQGCKKNFSTQSVFLEPIITNLERSKDDACSLVNYLVDSFRYLLEINFKAKKL